MSNRAWMPLHLDAYLADTGHLTTTEHGAYMLLIMHYWRNGGLPDDERMIARISRMGKEQWEESRDVLASLFRDGWKHKRIDEELAKADEIISKRKAAADKMHSKRRASAEHVHDTCSDTRVPPLTEDISDASASGAVAPLNPRDLLWREGVSILVAMTGKTEGAARQMIGKWCRDAKDDCAIILAKIRQAQADRIGDPISWVSAALKPPDKPPKPQTIGSMFLQDAINQGLIHDPASTSSGRLDTGHGSGQSDRARKLIQSAIPRSI